MQQQCTSAERVMTTSDAEALAAGFLHHGTLYALAAVSIWSVFFFFNDTATTEIYTLSLHDALPIFDETGHLLVRATACGLAGDHVREGRRSEEHTSELQSHSDLVCRLLLEKKKRTKPGER